MTYRIFVFGDSILDTGNTWIESNGTFPNPTLYPLHRFTNGLSMADYIGKQCTKNQVINSQAINSLNSFINKDVLINFSVASAHAETSPDKTNGISQLIDRYEGLANKSKECARIQSCDLVILEVGSNDVNSILRLENQTEAIQLYGTNMAAAVERLYTLGMRRLALFDVSPIQLSPKSLSLPIDEQNAIEKIVASLNTCLSSEVHLVATKLDQLDITLVPYNNIITSIAYQFTQFGLSNIRDAFLESEYRQDYFSTHDVRGYAFWDQIHPTNAGIEVAMPLLGKHLCPVKVQVSEPSHFISCCGL